jgi:hypothetical protein
LYKKIDGRKSKRRAVKKGGSAKTSPATKSNIQKTIPKKTTAKKAG